MTAGTDDYSRADVPGNFASRTHIMRIAAIDIGTNSLHMIVVRVRPDLSFEVIDREKEMVRLGAGGLDGRALTPEAMHAALQVLSKFRRLAESHRVDRIIAVATSAIREAENGGEFLDAITEQTGIRARVISGTEEARLIHLAAVYGVGSASAKRPSSSTSAAAASRSRAASGPTSKSGRSFKLGVIRLTERFVKSDPLAPRDERKLVRHIDAEAGEYPRRDRARRLRPRDRHVGHDPQPGRHRHGPQGRSTGAMLRNRRVSAKQLRRVQEAARRARASRSGCACRASSRAAPISSVAGAVLLDAILRRLGADDITLCDLSLREGLVLDYIARHRKEIAQADRYPDVRRRSVIELAERCNYWPEHAHAGRAAGHGALRADARRARADRSRARVARVRRAAPRHRRAHQLRAAITSTRTT